MENEEVILFKISNSTQPYMAAVSVCPGGGASVWKFLLSPPLFSDISEKMWERKKKRTETILIHIRQKPRAKLRHGLFCSLRLSKFPWCKIQHTPLLWWGWTCFICMLASREPIFLCYVYQSLFKLQQIKKRGESYWVVPATSSSHMTPKVFEPHYQSLDSRLFRDCYNSFV